MIFDEVASYQQGNSKSDDTGNFKYCEVTQGQIQWHTKLTFEKVTFY